MKESRRIKYTLKLIQIDQINFIDDMNMLNAVYFQNNFWLQSNYFKMNAKTMISINENCYAYEIKKMMENYKFGCSVC